MPARSKSQQRLFGMLHAYNKGEFSGSKSLKSKLKEMSEHISDEDARHFAETKHKGLPEKKAERLYTYLPKDNTASTEGLLSTSLTADGYKKYRGRTHKFSRDDVLRILDSWEPDWQRSKALSALSEPIPPTARQDLIDFAKEHHLYSFDTKDLIKAKILTHLRKTNRGKGTHEVQDVGREKIDWSKDRKNTSLLFRAIPHYMVETKDGKIPAELVRDEEQKRDNKTLEPYRKALLEVARNGTANSGGYA